MLNIKCVGNEWQKNDALFYWDHADDQIGIRCQGNVVESHGSQTIGLPKVPGGVFMRFELAQDPGTNERKDYEDLASHPSKYFTAQRFGINFGGSTGVPVFQGYGKFNPCIFDLAGSVFGSVFSNFIDDSNAQPGGETLIFKFDTRDLGSHGNDYAGFQQGSIKHVRCGLRRGGSPMFYGRANVVRIVDVMSTGRVLPDFHFVNSSRVKLDTFQVEGAAAEASILAENTQGLIIENAAIGHSTGHDWLGEPLGHSGVIFRNCIDCTIRDRLVEKTGTIGWAWRRDRGLVDGYAVRMDAECESCHVEKWSTHLQHSDTDPAEEFDIAAAHNCSVSGRDMQWGKRFKLKSGG